MHNLLFYLRKALKNVPKTQKIATILWDHLNLSLIFLSFPKGLSYRAGSGLTLKQISSRWCIHASALRHGFESGRFYSSFASPNKCLYFVAAKTFEITWFSNNLLQEKIHYYNPWEIILKSRPSWTLLFYPFGNYDIKRVKGSNHKKWKKFHFSFLIVIYWFQCRVGGI